VNQPADCCRSPVNRAYLGAIRGLAASVALSCAWAATSRAQRTILAVGAHAGDVELTSGALLAKQHRLGDRVVILHLTLGEGGNPRVPSAQYAEQKRHEALDAAKALGAEVLFGPYHDGELPDDDAARRYVADVIRTVKPTLVITHWRESIHKDHAAASRIVTDAVLLATLDGVRTEHAPYRGVRGVWYAENWEDASGFQPYISVDVTSATDAWREAATKYEFVRGGVSDFRYLEFYDALFIVRGALARKGRAEAFDIDASGKRRVLDSLP
jgi:LmbE family N-acetylglucosaminyl deacetylase